MLLVRFWAHTAPNGQISVGGNRIELVAHRNMTLKAFGFAKSKYLVWFRRFGHLGPVIFQGPK